MLHLDSTAHTLLVSELDIVPHIETNERKAKKNYTAEGPMSAYLAFDGNLPCGW